MPNPEKEPKPDHPQQGPIVQITVDNKPIDIHRGRVTIAEIKAKAGVPAAYDLDQLVEGRLEPRPDDGAVTLKGEEVFVSHPKDGGSA